MKHAYVSGAAFWLSIILSLGGCATLGSYRIKTFSTSALSKSQIDNIRGILTDNGYVQDGKKDFYWEGAYETTYRKRLQIGDGEATLLVELNFKTSDNTGMNFRNIGLRFFNADLIKSPEIDAEVKRMEPILNAAFFSTAPATVSTP